MDRTHELVPAARVVGLVMTEAGGEVLVYDERSHHIHRLNQASAAVWRLCDGWRSVADLAAGTRMTAELVQVALGKLADARLLDGEMPAGMRAAGQTRRRFLKKAAVAGGVALPVLVSISAPTAASHTSVVCIQGCTEATIGHRCQSNPFNCNQGITCNRHPTLGFVGCFNV